MPLPPLFEGRLSVPAIAAPMFLVSGPDLVVEACRAGVVGTFPALNQRTTEGYEAWLTEIETRLAAAESAGRRGPNWRSGSENGLYDLTVLLAYSRTLPVAVGTQRLLRGG